MRPDGWDVNELIKDVPRLCNSDGVVWDDARSKMCFEAGADAYEVAIWKMASESPTGTFTFDTNVVNVFELGEDK